jgi:predicted signal transduction protein with EAL and GGDEF domain
MYSAKWRGKGTHAIFDVGMHAKAVGRLRTEAELRRALDMGELEAHFQPIMRLDRGQVAAVEALMRWRHPIRGLVSPADFLPIAEESGLMLPMGRWILAEPATGMADLGCGARWPQDQRQRVGPTVLARTAAGGCARLYRDGGHRTAGPLPRDNRRRDHA